MFGSGKGQGRPLNTAGVALLSAKLLADAKWGTWLDFVTPPHSSLPGPTSSHSCEETL